MRTVTSIVLVSVAVMSIGACTAGKSGSPAPAPSRPASAGVAMRITATAPVFRSGDPVTLSVVVTNPQDQACVLSPETDGSFTILSLVRDGADVVPVTSYASYVSSFTDSLAANLVSVPAHGSVTMSLASSTETAAGDRQALRTTAASTGSEADVMVWPVQASGTYTMRATYLLPPLPSAAALCLESAVAAPVTFVVSDSSGSTTSAGSTTSSGSTTFSSFRPHSLKIDDDVLPAYNSCLKVFKDSGFTDLVDQLDNSRNTFTIARIDKFPHRSVSAPAPFDTEDTVTGTGTGGQTDWNPEDHGLFGDGVAEDRCATLYHEMRHLKDYNDGTNFRDTCFVMRGGKRVDTGIRINEVAAVRAENRFRLGQKPPLAPRTLMGGLDGKLHPIPTEECLPPPDLHGACYLDNEGVDGGPGCGATSGDPHLLTFDQTRYDFQAVGEFVAARSTTGSPLEVQVRQRPLAELSNIAVNTAVAANVDGDRVSIYETGGALALHIAGALVAPGDHALSHGGTVTQLPDGSIDIRWPDASEAMVGSIGPWALSVTMHLAKDRRNQMTGLLGNDDGQPDPQLTYAQLYPTFADSWRITAAQSLFDYASGESTATFTDRRYPYEQVQAKDLPNRAFAEAVCRQAGVTEQVTLDACIVDFGLTGQIAFAHASASTQALLSGAGGTILAVSQPGASARLTVHGVVGEKLFVDVTSSTLPDQCGALGLFDPQGQLMAGGCVVDGRGYIDATLLPVTGQYAIVLDPAGAVTGQMSLRLSEPVDQVGTLLVNGPSVRAIVGAPGEVATLSFDGTAGQRIVVTASAATVPDQCAGFALLDPAGHQVVSGCIIGGAGKLDAFTLLVSGRYAVQLDPGGHDVGTALIQVRD